MANGLFVSNTGSAFAPESSSPKPRELLDIINRMQKSIDSVSTILNMKYSGSHPLEEFVNGNTFFPNPNHVAMGVNPEPRPEYTKVLNFGALPSTATKTLAHGIVCNANTVITECRASSSDTTGFKYIEIPYASATDIDIVEIHMDNTNVSIKTGKNMSAYDTTIVVIKYLKN